MIQGILKGKKDRNKSDPSDDPDDAVFEQLAVDFNSASIVADLPPDELLHALKNFQKLDPNDVSLIPLICRLTLLDSFYTVILT